MLIGSVNAILQIFWYKCDWVASDKDCGNLICLFKKNVFQVVFFSIVKNVTSTVMKGLILYIPCGGHQGYL